MADKPTSATPSKRQMLDCSSRDPCCHDHTCSNHRLLAELESELAAAKHDLTALDAESVRVPREPDDDILWHMAGKPIGVWKADPNELAAQYRNAVVSALSAAPTSLPQEPSKQQIGAGSVSLANSNAEPAAVAPDAKDAARYRVIIASGAFDGNIEGFLADHDRAEAPGDTTTLEYKAVADEAADALIAAANAGEKK